jgi:hypothetical protein
MPGAPVFFSPPVFPILGGVGQLGPNGASTQTAHAAIGQQITINSTAPAAPDQDRVDFFFALAASGEVDLIAKGMMDGYHRGWVLDESVSPAPLFTSDGDSEPDMSLADLEALAGVGTELTFTIVPAGLGVRMGIDRDEDGTFDFVEYLINNPPATDGSSGLCFIATAAYGTPLAGQIGALRDLRDSTLLGNALGAAFTDAYYRVSPPAAAYIATRPALRAAARVLIAPIVWLAADNARPMALLAGITLLFAGAVVFTIAGRRQLRRRA